MAVRENMELNREKLLTILSIIILGVCISVIWLVRGFDIEVRFLASGVVASIILGVYNMLKYF